MKSLSLFLLFSIVSSMLLASEPVFIQERKLERIIRLDINSSINPATYSYLQAGFEEARKEDFQAILVTLNTPGGLVSVTKDILTLFGESELPIIVWIRPEGASATSAGAIIAAGAHLLYMSDGTNIGAATPIEMSGDIKQADARSKAINDLVALVQSLAETRQRNATLFAEMIEKASSFKSKEAKEKKLIDDIVNTTSELKQKINGSEFKIKGQRVRLSAEGTEIISFGMDLGQKLLDILANPSTAYILFILGAGLIYLELQAPGGLVAGSIGAVSLLLAGIGFQILPLNFGAFGLIILAFALLLMEIYITSYGVLTLAGLASLIAGSLFLFRSDDAYLHLSHSLIFSTVAGIAAFVALIGYVIYRDHTQKHETTFNDMTGKDGVVLKILGDELYQIKVSGEVWKAQGPKGLVLEQKVRVLEQSQDEMMVKIQSKS